MADKLLAEIGVNISGDRSNTKVFRPLYTTANDKVDVTEFHEKCDSKGPTVTLLYGRYNTLFGGYTSQNWLSTDTKERKTDSDAFLFYKNSDQGGECVFMPIKKETEGKAITCYANYGPTFGGSSKGSYDLQVFKHESRSKNQSSHASNYMILNGTLKPGKCYKVGRQKETRNEINSGKLEVTRVEVYQVVEDELPSNWREEPKDFEEMKKELIDMEPHAGLDVKHYNILLVGAVGSGKSSFCNTLGTIFSEDVTPYAAVGTAPKSLTNKKNDYDLTTKNGKPLKIRITDIRGIENDRGLEHEFPHILGGRLPSEFQFPRKNQGPIDEDQLIDATLNEKIHLVCFVTFTAHLDTVTDDLRKHFKYVKEEIAERGLPTAVVVTKMDEICACIAEDVDHIYKCTQSRNVVRKATEVFGFPENQIFPIVNYTKEVKPKRGIDKLALYALYKMYLLVNAHLQKHEEMTTNVDNWGKRDSTLRHKARKENEKPELTTRIMELTRKHFKKGEKELRILCFGPSRSGKSSFIDSLLSTFRHEIRSDATGGSTDESSVTTMFQQYQIEYESDAKEKISSNVYLADMPGIQEEGGFQLKEAKLIVRGHVANKCKIQNGVPKDSKKYITKPQSNDRIHCVCFVFDLFAVDRLSSSTLRKCCEFKTWLTERSIPFVVVVTNCDRVSEVVKQNPTRVFEDRRIKECKDKLVKLFGVKESTIFPVRNYVDETTTISQIEVLLLNVMSEVLRLGHEHLEGLEKDPEFDEESDENGSEQLQDASL